MSNLRLPLLTDSLKSDVPKAEVGDLMQAMHVMEVMQITPVTPVMQVMQVGDLARESGKTVRAIHLYEQMDLLKPAARSKGRYRLYGPEALVRIRWIQKLQDLGFSLTDIKAIVKEVEQHSVSSASAAMGGVRALYLRKLDETRAQVARLQALEGEIQASLEYLEACSSLCERDRLMPACQCCDHHPAEQEVPDLVAGFRS